MHLIGISRAIYEANPWVAVNLLKAFMEAKDRTMYEISQIGHLFSSLPWSMAEYQQTVGLMGKDFWPYGVAENWTTLECFLGYHHSQGFRGASFPSTNCLRRRHFISRRFEALRL